MLLLTEADIRDLGVRNGAHRARLVSSLVMLRETQQRHGKSAKLVFACAARCVALQVLAGTNCNCNCNTRWHLPRTAQHVWKRRFTVICTCCVFIAHSSDVKPLFAKGPVKPSDAERYNFCACRIYNRFAFAIT